MASEASPTLPPGQPQQHSRSESATAPNPAWTASRIQAMAPAQQRPVPTKLQLLQRHLKQQQQQQRTPQQEPHTPRSPRTPQTPQTPHTPQTQTQTQTQTPQAEPSSQDVEANRRRNAEAAAQNRHLGPVASQQHLQQTQGPGEGTFHKPRRKQALVHPLQLRVSKHYRISHVARPDSLYRSLNDQQGGLGEGKAKRRETAPYTATVAMSPTSPTNPRRVASNAAAANKAAAAVHAAARPPPPLCSSRARAASGDVTWSCDVVQNEDESTTPGAGPAAAGSPTSTSPAATGSADAGGAGSPAAASSPSGTPTGGTNGNSLRASIFKKSSALLYGGSSSSTSSAGQRDADGTDKGGKLKPWRPEVPPGTPYYLVPPPNRRFGGLAKNGGRALTQSKGSAAAAAVATNAARSGQGLQAGSTQRSRSGSSTSIMRASSGVTAKATAGNTSAISASGRVQKAPVVRYLDFNPWKRRHPEDRFTEATIRGGYSDRLPNSAMQAAEKSSARSWLPLLLRQKHATPMLGHALAMANALSREKNYIVPASQFKLPPRVTVTDTRRETWLRDLTNPVIPLRKLSRTIPHGLRGKILLEQCMLKAVPVDRAMWLARCVGAQELRAFKRKGTATIVTLAESEVRWLKDWTLLVQQFLEGFLVELDLGTGTAAGQDRLQYAARFTRQLYLERLLDHNQFLAWMLDGLRHAALVPMATVATLSPPVAFFDVWLCLVEEYLPDIMERRNAASHLAVTVLRRLEYLFRMASQASASSTHCKKLLETMALGYPDAFVCQAVWPRYEQQLVRALLVPTSQWVAADRLLASLDAASTIRHRNHCLRPEKTAELDEVLTTLQPLDEALLRPVVFRAHFAAFLRLNRRKTIPFVIRWCASLHRPGLAKVYIAAQLLRTLCKNDAARVTSHMLAFLSSSRQKHDASNTHSTPTTKDNQADLHYLRDQQPEGNKALYQLAGLLAKEKLFSPPQYLASLILQSRPSDGAEIRPCGVPQVRLAAELPVHLLDRATVNLRTNHLRRLGYDTEFEAQDIADLLREVRAVLDMHDAAPVETAASSESVAGSPASVSMDHPMKTDTPLPSEALSALAQRIEDRSRNAKMAVADYVAKQVIAPLRDYRPTSSHGPATTHAGPRKHVSFRVPNQVDNSQASSTSPALMRVEKANAIRALVEKTDDLRLLAEWILVLARTPQSIAVVALCADAVHLHLTAFAALGLARVLYDTVMRRALAITVGVDAGATTAFQTLLPAGTDLRPLVLALPALAEKMPPPGPGSLVLWANMQPVRVVPLPAAAALASTTRTTSSAKPAAATAAAAAAAATSTGSAGTDRASNGGLNKHFDSGPAMANEIQTRLLAMAQRISVATYDADCSPLSDGRGLQPARPEDAAADEVRDELAKITSSGGAIDSTTMDRLFGTVAMFSQERWRRLQPEGGSGSGSGSGTGSVAARAREDVRLSASLFARLRRMNKAHFDTIMVKWLKRLRILRERPAIGTIYPVFVVFGCLDLASLMATTADEQQPGGLAQSPARNTWRTSYLQDVLALLAVPMAEHHALLMGDECLRFRVFQSEAPYAMPAAVAALVRNAVAEMTLWRRQLQQQRQHLLAQQASQASQSPSQGQSQGQSPQSQPASQQSQTQPRTAQARKPIDALAVSRLLRAAAVADAPAAAQALGKTTDPSVRTGLWEMMTLALTRQVRPSRSALDMLRELDVFAADVGQLALGLVASSTSSPADPSKEADGLARLVVDAVAGFGFAHLRVLYSLPADMATSLKNHAQARFLALLPTMTNVDTNMDTNVDVNMDTDDDQDAGNFRVASGLLDVVRTVMLHQQQQQISAAADKADVVLGTPILDAAIVDKLGDLWCLLQEPMGAVRQDDEKRGQRAILRDWLPALLTLILLHLPNHDALAMGDGRKKRTTTVPSSRSVGTGAGLSLEQESVRAGACVALARLWGEMASLADEPTTESDGHLALQRRVYDVALLLADGLSNETRLHCVRVLREAAAAAGAAVAAAGGAMGAAGDLPPALAYMLSSPLASTIDYPRLYLERLPSMPVPRAKGKTAGGAGGGASGSTTGTAAPPLKRIVASLGFGGLLGNDRNRRVRFGLKTWDAVSDPNPTVQDNDTAVNLWLLEATKVARERKR